MGWGGWHETRVCPLGLLGQEVKAKGEGLPVHHGSVSFPLVPPTTLEHTPGTSSEFTLLLLSDRDQRIRDIHLTDATTSTPPHLPAPK